MVTGESQTIDLPMVAILIAVLNLIYVIRSLMSEPMRKAEQPMDRDEAPTILVRRGTVTKKLDVKEDILYFYLSKPNVTVVTCEREYSLDKGTINEMEKLYSPFDFCRISSHTLVNMSFVKDLVPTTTRYNFKLVFIEPAIIPNPDSDELLVKGDYSKMVMAFLKK